MVVLLDLYLNTARMPIVVYLLFLLLLIEREPVMHAVYRDRRFELAHHVLQAAAVQDVTLSVSGVKVKPVASQKLSEIRYVLYFP